MIRRPSIEDAPGLAKVHIETWQEIYKHDFPADFLEGLDVEARIKWFRHIIKQGSSIVLAEESGLIVGFCLVGDARGEDGWGELFAIYVLPEYWGGGYGRDLAREGEELLVQDGFQSALLWVLDTNTRARSFYERQGWELAKPIRIEEIGGVQVTERRYEKRFGPAL